MNERTLRVLEYDKIIDLLKNKAESFLGKEICEKLKPSTKLEEVEKLQQETDEAFRIITSRGTPPLGGIHDVSNEIKRAEIGAVLSAGSLLKIADSLRAARRLKGFIRQDKGDKQSNYLIIETLISNLATFKEIEDNIFNAIISEEEISDNASAALRNIRKQIELKHTTIRNKLNSIISSQKYKKYLQESLVTIREGRFVVPVKQEYKSEFPGLVHDQSSSGATLFIEPMAVVELNNQLKELKIEEQKEIERILAELTEMVAQKSSYIRENQKYLSYIDFIFAKAKLAVDLDAVKPKLNNNGYINIKSGRHPLLNKESVVPTNIFLGKEFDTLVITGPNTGGKTVTLKTVGLLTLIAQSGLHVPTDHGTEIAVFSSIFADIGDEQSIEQSLSTFSSHMTNIVNILDKIDDNSLVLLDELGAGTDPTEGAALAMSILDFLHSRGIKTIATTHYSELKIYALTTKGIENASVEFDVETLSPTYRLLIGIPGKSNAFEISKRLGLNNLIIEKAKEMITKENLEFEDVLAKIEKDRRISEENRRETEKLRLEVARLKEELAEKKEKLAQSRDKMLREARQEARRILMEAKNEADSLVKELRNLSVEIGKERNRKIQEAQDRLKSNINQIESQLTENILTRKNTKPPKDLKPGDSVEILSLNQKGVVVTSPDGDGNLTVQVGIMKINVNISNLKSVESEEDSKAVIGTKTMVKTKSKTIRQEIDLRGKTLEEAILDVDKYLDDAYIAGLNEVTIIHGKGTGVLREGISQLLKSHRHVKGFRLGKYNEGGSGVTVVELK